MVSGLAVAHHLMSLPAQKAVVAEKVANPAISSETGTVEAPATEQSIEPTATVAPEAAVQEAKVEIKTERIADGLQEIALALVAGHDKPFISLIAQALDKVECNDGENGAAPANLEGVQKLINELQNIYTTAKGTKDMDPKVLEAAIQKKLQSLNLSQEQKALMQEYLQKVLEANPAKESKGKDPLAFLKNLALSKEGMLAVGTALYVFSNLIAKIPVIGHVLATPLKGVQGLLHMGKELIPMLLLLDKKEKTTPPEPAKAEAPKEASKAPADTAPKAQSA